MGLAGVEEIALEFLCDSGGCETVETAVDAECITAVGMGEAVESAMEETSNSIAGGSGEGGVVEGDGGGCVDGDTRENVKGDMYV